jgi:hypothetical protein
MNLSFRGRVHGDPEFTDDRLATRSFRRDSTHSWRTVRDHIAGATGKAQEGESAMSASIIRAATAGHRQPLRAHGIAALRLFPAVMLLLYASLLAAEEPQRKPVLETNSFYLSSAGFRMQVANDPAGQRALRALPAHRFVTNGVGEALRYSYAEPQHCVCIFVGDQLKRTESVAPDYKTQAGVLLSGQPLRQSTRGDPTTLSDYLSTLSPRY